MQTPQQEVLLSLLLHQLAAPECVLLPIIIVQPHLILVQVASRVNLKIIHFALLLLLLVLGGLLVSCGGKPQETPLPTPPPATATLPLELPTHTPPPPTPTPEPLAATVNGEPLTLAEFEVELALFQAAQLEVGTNLATDEASAWVLDSLIDSLLLAQAAGETGFVLDNASVQKRIDALVAQLGSSQALADWIAAHGYTETGFRQALGREIAAAWMRDQIAAGVPESADQAHARQILLYNLEQAEQVLDALQSGQDFAALAYEYDPVTGGDLGWFPRGTLFSSAVEEAAFSLEPGQYSAVIETPLGFHIVQLVERDPQHPLSPDARQVLQLQALNTWLTQRRSQSDIQVLLP